LYQDTSSQNADVIIPEVLQTDTNEHVKETSAQKADTIIPEVPQIDESSSISVLGRRVFLISVCIIQSLYKMIHGIRRDGVRFF
jgi:hypothetical protein